LLFNSLIFSYNFALLPLKGKNLIPADATLIGVLLVSGFISGFCSSAPLGPINLWLINATLSDTKLYKLWFLSGVVVVDMGFAAIALWGYFSLIKGSSITDLWGLIGGGFLIILGIVMFLKNRTQDNEESSPNQPDLSGANRMKSFITGTFLCGSNPAFLMFWIFVVNYIENKLPLTPSLSATIFFVTGVAFGDFIWFSLLVKITRLGIGKIKFSYLAVIRNCIAAGFVIFGMIALVKHGLESLNT